jgi:hypothetical protein
MKGLDAEWEKIRSCFNNDNIDKGNEYLDEIFCDESKADALKSYFHRHFYDFFAEEDLEPKDLDHILYKIHFDINSKYLNRKGNRFNNIVKWTLRIAGLIFLPVLIYIGTEFYRDYISKKEAWVEINSPAWTRTQFRLPDGTVGWLNSNSSVRYKANFLSDRQVNLDGEAFFNVIKKHNKPFIVHTSEINITVLGTRFNVSAYSDERNVEVVLEEGRLLFSDYDMKYPQILSPNDLLVYNKDLKSITSEVVKPKKYLAWTEGSLVFRNDPIDVVARRLGRWYNVDVELKKDIDSSLRLRATFVDEGLEEVMKILKLSLPVDFKIEAAAISSDSIYSKKKVIIFSDKR